MSTSGAANLPGLRKSLKRSCEKIKARSTPEDGASLVLRSRKRKGSFTQDIEEAPAAKKMVNEANLLTAMNSIKASVENMERRVVEKRDIETIHLKVDSHTNRINDLYAQRAKDESRLTEKVERLVELKLADIKSSRTGVLSITSSKADKEKAFFLARRTARLWPIDNGMDLLGRVTGFLIENLLIPEEVAKGLRILDMTRVQPQRRSQIEGEVVVLFKTADERDVVQSYTSNLATAKSPAGLRMEIPDHLRGLFKQFEKHAGALKQKHKDLKRSIKFDDSNQSLAMDVKLSGATGWHRVTATEMRQLVTRFNEKKGLQHQAVGLGAEGEERREVLMLTPKKASGNGPELVVVEDEEEERSGAGVSRN